MSDITNGIRRIDDNTYDIYIREDRRRSYRRSVSFKRPGVFGLRSQDWWKGGKEPQTDSQRQRCYDAEQAIRLGITQRKYGTVREAATFFRNIMESDWFQRRFPHFFFLRIRYEPGTRAAHAKPTEHVFMSSLSSDFRQHVARGWIGFSSWAMGERGLGGGELIMLHELAHAILPEGHSHDRRWARTFLEMVKHYMGADVGAKLKASMIEKGVKFKQPRKISEAQRLAAAARFAKFRATAGLAACSPI